MTTIAWDGTILATDSRTCTNESRIVLHRVSTKIHMLPSGWASGCGNRGDVLAIVRWLRSGKQDDVKPTFQDDRSAVFFIDRKHRCWHLGADLREDDQPWPARVAMGSGGELAWGAMHAGVSAIEAVRIAVRFDINSGLPVQWINTRTGESGKSK